MADTKISELTSSDPIASGDQIPVVRSGNTIRVSAPTLDAVPAAIADVSINSHKLTNVNDPTNPQDASTKNYVDAHIATAFEKVLTNAEILLLPTTPVIIIPATETLNYTGFPSVLYYPTITYALLDSSGGGYTNVSTGATDGLVLAWGSDWSVTIGFSGEPQLPAGGLEYGFLRSQIGPRFQSFWVIPDFCSAGDFQDNAMVITASNSAGNYTGGNASNTLTIRGYYISVIT